eukprot:10808861-Lingulodinium_polyedra.AAC.1
MATTHQPWPSHKTAGHGQPPGQTGHQPHALQQQAGWERHATPRNGRAPNKRLYHGQTRAQ